ncbi:uncharacterized protein Pyn_24975 [Prunus yedoensis var. nudiflora]|uniref:Uncharacterized protein n=1 Tax=Prunus yedoensis var. nudiflora TaxID=2094558 RepID=A0A314YT61_PRUYE|nr:uncharacterized protein Pyn_24975 [Prunus yedoensis var. nudiflora]
MVQLHTHHDPAPAQQKPSNQVEKTARVGHPHPQPSDHHLNQGLLPIGRAEKGWGFSDAAGEDKHKEHNKQDCGLVQVYVVVDPWVWCGWFFRKESILGAETLMGFASGSSSFSHRAVGRWCEGEKAFPLKKRRGSFGRGANMEEKDRKSMKTKMNKKCATQQQNDDVRSKRMKRPNTALIMPILLFVVIRVQQRRGQEAAVHSWRGRGAVELMEEDGGVASKLLLATLFASITWAREG